MSTRTDRLLYGNVRERQVCPGWPPLSPLGMLWAHPPLGHLQSRFISPFFLQQQSQSLHPAPCTPQSHLSTQQTFQFPLMKPNTSASPGNARTSHPQPRSPTDEGETTASDRLPSSATLRSRAPTTSHPASE